MYLILLSFLLGVKHSYDADHLLAVSGYLTKSSSLKQALKLGIYWAVGHMITASVITILLFSIQESLLRSYLKSFEYVVGVMLIAISIYTLKDFVLFSKYGGLISKHKNKHQHETHEIKHHHKYLFGIGIVHGLASNDEILLLLTISLGVVNIYGILACVSVFSLGVIAGMCIFVVAMTVPVLKSLKVKNLLTITAGVSSLVYGVLILAR